jgi:hypothetical protein
MTHVFLPDPPDPGVLGVDTFLHVMFVDEDRGIERLVARRLFAHPADQLAKAIGGEYMVIVVATSVTGHAPRCRVDHSAAVHRRVLNPRRVRSLNESSEK